MFVTTSLPRRGSGRCRFHGLYGCCWWWWQRWTGRKDEGKGRLGIRDREKLKTVKGRRGFFLLDASDDSVAVSTLELVSGSVFSLGRKMAFGSADNGNESWLVVVWSVSNPVKYSKGVRAEVIKGYRTKRKHAIMMILGEATFLSIVIVVVTNFQREYKYYNTRLPVAEERKIRATGETDHVTGANLCCV